MSEQQARGQGQGQRSVLVLNAGSSSLKWSVLRARSEETVAEDTVSLAGVEREQHHAQIAAALEQAPAVDAVGHRVVHGGRVFQDAVVVDDEVCAQIGALAELAPLHNPTALAGIAAARQRYPDKPQVAAFDTAFHATLPDEAALYPVPWAWIQRWGVRRFGFHGLSVEYALSQATAHLGRQPERLVVCHLGAGCSITAVRRGRSLDTTMGFTPLEGLMMARRSGSVDPGLLVYLLRRGALTVEELDRGLNEQAGWQGISGRSDDMRQVLAAREAGDERARLAVALFVYRAVGAIGSLVAHLEGLDALVFTGGVGEHSPVLRQEICAPLAYLGVTLDAARTTAHPLAPAPAPAPATDLAPASSAVRVLVVTAREDLTILRAVKRLLRWG